MLTTRNYEKILKRKKRVTSTAPKTIIQSRDLPEPEPPEKPEIQKIISTKEVSKTKKELDEEREKKLQDYKKTLSKPEPEPEKEKPKTRRSYTRKKTTEKEEDKEEK